MSEPWFDPNRYAWIPGTLLGVFGGVLGSLGGILAPHGKAKGFVLGCWVIALVLCAGMLIASVVAFFTGQPYGIWYGFGLPGLLGVVVLGSLCRVIVMRYREAELRRVQAQDLR